MKATEFKVGHFYVNKDEGLARELYAEIDEGVFYWRSYDLETGKATGDKLMCSRTRMAQWSEREATPEEVARFGRTEFHDRERMNATICAELFLQTCPDGMLLNEVRRRGLKL